MRNIDHDAILQAAARALVWDLFAAGAYGRSRARVNLEHFDRELRAALRHWTSTQKNLNHKKET